MFAVVLDNRTLFKSCWYTRCMSWLAVYCGKSSGAKVVRLY